LTSGNPQILAHFVQQRLETTPDILSESHAPLNYAAIAGQTEGYAAIDLEDLVARAMHQAVMRAGTDIDAQVST
jgi:peroxin-1